MIEIPVYIPQDRPRWLSSILPRSAIVGTEQPDADGILVIYYEGNKYGAENMVTFCDRAMFAYWRMRDHYPTVAMLAVMHHAVVRAATLYPEHGRVEVRNGRELMMMSRYLATDEGPLSTEQLNTEFRTSGVRNPTA